VNRNTLGAYPGGLPRRSIVGMNSQTHTILVAYRIEDSIHAAARARLIRELRRESRAAARTRPAGRRRFLRHAVPRTPAA
jgi:hypothetical protein